MKLHPEFKTIATLCPDRKTLIIEGGLGENIHNALGDSLWLKVEKYSAQRSSPQNAWYHGFVVPPVMKGLQDSGMAEIKTEEQAHEWLKDRFLSKEHVNAKTGLKYKCAKSSASLTKLEFYNYIEEIRQFAAEYLYINIPDPFKQPNFD